MGRILENFSNVLRVLIGVLMAILFIPVFMQVVARLGVIPVYLWTEELSTFIFVWVVMLGAMLAVWDSTHFDVRVIPDAENPLLKLIQVGFVHLLIFVVRPDVHLVWYRLCKTGQHPEFHDDAGEYADHLYHCSNRGRRLGIVFRLSPV